VCACALTISLLMLNMLLAQCVEGLMWNHCGDASGRGMELLCRILEPIDRHSQCNCPCAFLSVKLLSVSARAHVAAERERDLGGGGSQRSTDAQAQQIKKSRGSENQDSIICMHTYIPFRSAFARARTHTHTHCTHTSHLRTKTLRSSPPWEPLTALTPGVSERPGFLVTLTPLSPCALSIPAACESVGCCTVGSVVDGGLQLCVCGNSYRVTTHVRIFSKDKDMFVQ